jgi:hypothetical protein
LTEKIFPSASFAFSSEIAGATHGSWTWAGTRTSRLSINRQEQTLWLQPYPEEPTSDSIVALRQQHCQWRRQATQCQGLPPDAWAETTVAINEIEGYGASTCLGHSLQ